MTFCICALVSSTLFCWLFIWLPCCLHDSNCLSVCLIFSSKDITTATGQRQAQGSSICRTQLPWQHVEAPAQRTSLNLDAEYSQENVLSCEIKNNILYLVYFRQRSAVSSWACMCLLFVCMHLHVRMNGCSAQGRGWSFKTSKWLVHNRWRRRHVAACVFAWPGQRQMGDLCFFESTCLSETSLVLFCFLQFFLNLLFQTFPGCTDPYIQDTVKWFSFDHFACRARFPSSKIDETSHNPQIPRPCCSPASPTILFFFLRFLCVIRPAWG